MICQLNASIQSSYLRTLSILLIVFVVLVALASLAPAALGPQARPGSDFWPGRPGIFCRSSNY